jgi:hypothetical protein
MHSSDESEHTHVAIITFGKPKCSCCNNTSLSYVADLTFIAICDDMSLLAFIRQFTMTRSNYRKYIKCTVIKELNLHTSKLLCLMCLWCDGVRVKRTRLQVKH